MSTQEKKNRLAAFATIAILTLSFAAIYYVSTDTYQQQSVARQKRVEAINTTGQSRLSGKQIVLRRGERLEIERTALVYKGVEEKKLLIDLYLLDLDSEQGYLKKIRKKTAKEGVDLGGIKYRLLSQHDRYIILQILNTPSTP